ncbi:ubiquitin-like domain-containing protein [Rutidosis leptorrhynchoides]|uniref:ubiquitin-like domain-containing protein n=1 Tax=Rutidosis leptorrhynchoides TaxID=125765 RepID=UPI003A99A734
MAGDSNSESGVTVTLYVRCPSNGTKFAVEARLEGNVEMLKSVIEEKCEIESWEQSLIFKGRVLENNQTLQSYGLEAEDTVHLARGYVPGCGRSPPRVNGVIPLQHTPSMLGPTAHIIQNMHDCDPQFREMIENRDFHRLCGKPNTIGQWMTQGLCTFSGLDRDAGLTVGASVTPEELFATIRPELVELGFFNVRLVVESSHAKFDDVKTSLVDSVESFKSVLEPIFEIPAGRQCLIYEGRILEDDHTLLSYGLTGGHNVYLIVLDGPLRNQAANPNPRTANRRTALGGAGSSPAHIIQGMYDSDPFFRQMMKSPALFRQFCSGSSSSSSMTEEEMMTIHLSLLSGLGQEQTRGG